MPYIVVKEVAMKIYGLGKYLGACLSVYAES